MNVCIGGTFDPLHRGHKVLIKKALEVAGSNGSVFIGISSIEMIKNKKEVKPFEERKKAIERFLSKVELPKNVTIGKIYDKYGPSLVGNFNVIVVSPETIHTAREINKKRKEIKKKPLKIMEIPFVLAEDNLPIRSTRIKNKEIDENGNIVKQD
jgi:pantetheine-phosphate adenylyltransferase